MIGEKMPPKVKVTKEMVANASFEVVRERGHENLNTRTIAEYLGCSTQPVLYNFKTVEEIKKAAYEIADDYHTSFVMPKESDQNPLLSLGLNYVRFGHEEKNLFRFLFQTDMLGGMDMTALIENPELLGILNVMAKGIGCGVEEAKEVFMTFFCAVHGLASLHANNSVEYDEEENTKMLENVFYGILTTRVKSK
jgi:AcrR family transcriptional regulator